MKVFFISPIGRESYLLYDTFVETFVAEGHEIVGDIEQANCVFYDLWCGWGDYDQNVMKRVIDKWLPVIVFDFFDFNDRIVWQGFNGFKDVISEQWASYLAKLIELGLVKAYFMRKMNSWLAYPSYVHPIECVQYPDHVFEPVSKEELWSRPNDIFFIGNTSKERESVCNELAKHFKCDFVLGQERIPHENWIARARQAKFFLTSCGGGYSCERPYQLIYVSPMIRQKSNHLQSHPFKNDVSCINVDVMPTEMQIEDIKYLMTENWIYSLYLGGIAHMEHYYSSKARAKYILNILKQNNIQ